MSPLVYLLIILALSALLAGLAWMWLGDLLALNKEYRDGVVTLPEDIFTTSEIKEKTKDDSGKTIESLQTIHSADMDYVADLLSENGFIQYKWLFKLFSSFTHSAKKLSPGTYQLNTEMDYNALINSLSSRSGSRMTVDVTIPEGYTLDQVFSLLAEKGVSTVPVLKKVAAEYDFKYSFLQGVLPLGDYHRLEGYLFPDTYEFYMGGGESEAVQVLNKMILRFDQQFSEELRTRCAEMGYSIHDMVTIASLIEKESDGEDAPHVASVIYNRLERPNNETVGKLDIDATLVYALGRTITQNDYTADTPYNTYTNPGLPPGPIANPGLISLNAAFHPDSSEDYFYVLGKDNLHHFFKTHKGQLDYIAEMKANG